MDRGVIHDTKAYKRMKRFVEETLEQFLESHTVKKDLYNDDAIVIHGVRPSSFFRGWELGHAVDEKVLKALHAAGIEYKVKRWPKNKDIIWVNILVDQDACPRPRNFRRKEFNNEGLAL